MLNNHRENLRIVTPAQSNYNHGIQRNNTSGYPGITWLKKRKIWEVKIGATYYGQFHDLDEAIAARKRAEQERYGPYCLSLSRGLK